jgi:hypothetical protein
MKKNVRNLLVSITLAAAAGSAVAQDHSHLYIAAVGTNQNDPLIFDDVAIFETASDYVKTLTYTNGSRYAGYYQGNITVSPVAATVGHAAYAPNAAAFGAWIFAELTSVDGPAGGEFAFWENGATNPTLRLVCGATGTNIWQLTETNGTPGTDPYGHIHGRRFTATKPGVYVVGFRALDRSTNGVGGGPIHAPSSVLKMYFQAGDTIRAIEPDEDHTHVTIGARAGYSWQLQAASSLTANDWGVIAPPVTGDDYFHEVVDETAVEGERYYRIKGMPIAP